MPQTNPQGGDNQVRAGVKDLEKDVLEVYLLDVRRWAHISSGERDRAENNLNIKRAWRESKRVRNRIAMIRDYDRRVAARLAFRRARRVKRHSIMASQKPDRLRRARERHSSGLKHGPQVQPRTPAP